MKIPLEMGTSLEITTNWVPLQSHSKKRVEGQVVTSQETLSYRSRSKACTLRKNPPGQGEKGLGVIEGRNKMEG